MKKHIVLIIIIIFLLPVLYGCELGTVDKTESEDYSYSDNEELQSILEPDELKDRGIVERSIAFYFWNGELDVLETESRSIFIYPRKNIYQQVIQKLIEGPAADNLDAVINSDTVIVSLKWSQNILMVNLSNDFLKSIDMLAAKASLVNTLIDLENVDYVEIEINGEALVNEDNEKEDNLYERFSNDIKTLREKLDVMTDAEIAEHTALLYFPDVSGRYLIPEVRYIDTSSNDMPKRVAEEIVKGPKDTNKAAMQIMPQGTQILDAIKDDKYGGGVRIYLSQEFISDDNFWNEKGRSVIGSLVWSLTALPDVNWVDFRIKNANGYYRKMVLGDWNLNYEFTREDVHIPIGRMIVVYFPYPLENALYPEFRVCDAGEENVAEVLLDEIIKGPVDNNLEVVIDSESKNDINMLLDDNRAIIDISSDLILKLGVDGFDMMSLYSLVNTICEPLNGLDVNSVQFTINGERIEYHGDINISEPFLRNPILNKN